MGTKTVDGNTFANIEGKWTLISGPWFDRLKGSAVEHIVFCAYGQWGTWHKTQWAIYGDKSPRIGWRFGDGSRIPDTMCG